MLKSCELPFTNADERADFNWFPGHMAKAKKELKEKAHLVDVVVEMVDARAPVSTRNFEFNDFLSTRRRVLLLNKCDLADDFCTDQWLKFYNKSAVEKRINMLTLKMDSRNCNLKDSKLKAFFKAIHKLSDKKNTKIMVVGIPNVGKSSFINRIVGKNVAQVQNKPGITRTNQWFAGNFDVDILDTPGIFPVKFSSKRVADNLAILGTVRDSILDIDSLAISLVDKIKVDFSKKILERYKLNFCENDIKNMSSVKIIEQIAQKRSMSLPGGKSDFSRACSTLIYEFRNGKIGKTSMEKVNFFDDYKL